MLQTFIRSPDAAPALRRGLRTATRLTAAERRAIMKERGIETIAIHDSFYDHTYKIYAVVHNGRWIYTGRDGSIPIITKHAECIGSIKRCIARGRSGESQFSLLLRYLDAPNTAHGRAAFAAGGGEIYDRAD